MSDSNLRPIASEKRTEPIVQTQHVRRAGSRRQGLIALFAIAVIGGVVAGGYLLFVPREETHTLAEYSSATVEVETLQDTVELAGVVAARNNATVTAPEQGFMSRLLVSEGDWVTSGQVVAVLDAESLEGSVEGLERDLQRSLREYDRFLLQHEYALRGYERDRLNLQERVEDAETDLEEARELYRIETISRSELSDAEEAVDDAQDAIQDHEALVEEAVALHELSRQNYEDDIAALREEIDDLRARLAETRVTAPITGRVVSIEDAATVSGELLKQYATILEIADTRDPVIRSEIEEQYVSLIDVGTPVAVEVGGSRRPAAIERIGQFASSSSEGGTPTVELDIAVDSVADELLPGSSALVEVLIGQIDDALVLPRGPYLTSGNRRYLYRIAGERAERIEVEYGTITDERVQIVTGVRPGDRIVTSSYQSFVDKRTITLGGDQ